MSFVYRGPLDPNSPLFRGRAAELDSLQRVCQGEIHGYACLFGGRQTGKTSVLLRLAAMLPENTRACKVDFQAIPQATALQTYTYLAQRVAESLPKAPNVPATLDSHGLIRYLCEALQLSAVKHYALLLDELGALPVDTRQNLAHVLRAMFTGRLFTYPPLERLRVVLAGGIELYDLAATEVSTLRNICVEIHLPDLNEIDAIDLITAVFGGVGVEYERGKLLGQTIYTYVGGHPYLTQRLGGYLLDALSVGEQLGAETVQRAVHQLRQDNPLLGHLWRAIREYDLSHAVVTLLQDSVRFNRTDGEMAQLELLGLAKQVGEHWQVRNVLLAEAIQEWVGRK